MPTKAKNFGRREDHTDAEVPPQKRSRERMTSNCEHEDHHNRGGVDHHVAGTIGMHQHNRKNPSVGRSVDGLGDHRHHAAAGGGTSMDSVMLHDSGTFAVWPIGYGISEDQDPTAAGTVGGDQVPVVRWR